MEWENGSNLNDFPEQEVFHRLYTLGREVLMSEMSSTSNRLYYGRAESSRDLRLRSSLLSFLSYQGDIARVELSSSPSQEVTYDNIQALDVLLRRENPVRLGAYPLYEEEQKERTAITVPELSSLGAIHLNEQGDLPEEIVPNNIDPSDRRIGLLRQEIVAVAREALNNGGVFNATQVLSTARELLPSFRTRLTGSMDNMSEYDFDILLHELIWQIYLPLGEFLIFNNFGNSVNLVSWRVDAGSWRSYNYLGQNIWIALGASDEMGENRAIGAITNGRFIFLPGGHESLSSDFQGIMSHIVASSPNIYSAEAHAIQQAAIEDGFGFRGYSRMDYLFSVYEEIAHAEAKAFAENVYGKDLRIGAGDEVTRAILRLGSPFAAIYHNEIRPHASSDHSADLPFIEFEGKLKAVLLTMRGYIDHRQYATAYVAFLHFMWQSMALNESGADDQILNHMEEHAHLYSLSGRFMLQEIAREIGSHADIRSEEFQRDLLTYCVRGNLIGHDNLLGSPNSIQGIYGMLSRIYRRNFITETERARMTGRPAAAGRDMALSSKKGGIDLASVDRALVTQNAGQDIKFHIDPAQLAQFQNAPGLMIGSMTIQPLEDLPKFLGLKQSQP